MSESNLLKMVPSYPLMLTPEAALNALINSSGNMDLAAERCHTTPSELLVALSKGLPADELQSTLRTLMSIHIYQSVMTTAAVYATTLPELSAYEVAKTYTNLLTLLNSVTQNQVAPININLQETVLKMLPPEIRQTVVDLVKSNGNGNGNGITDAESE